jgi:hypothetical protein
MTYTAATIMLNLIDGIGPTGVDRTTFDNKLAAANLFTRTIDPELDGLNLQVTYAERDLSSRGVATPGIIMLLG